MTWAELVHTCNMIVSEGAGRADNDYQKQYYVELQKVQNEVFNAVSLARIATALEKIAGMDTEVETDDYLEK